MRDKNLLMKQCSIYQNMCAMENILNKQGMELGDNYLDGLFFKVEDQIIDQICNSLGYAGYNETVGERLAYFSDAPLQLMVDELWDKYQNNDADICTADVIEMARFFTPAQIGRYLNLDLADDITLRDFDEALSDYNLWNYPISECRELIENDLHVVLVKIEDGFRFVELPHREIDIS